MCAQFALKIKANDLSIKYGIQVPESFFKVNSINQQGFIQARYLPYTVAPTIVLGRNADELKLVPMSFSLVPSWSKEPKVKFATHNARIETVIEKPTWKIPFQKNHCVIPMTGFFESAYEGPLAGHIIQFQSKPHTQPQFKPQPQSQLQPHDIHSQTEGLSQFQHQSQSQSQALPQMQSITLPDLQLSDSELPDSELMFAAGVFDCWKNPINNEKMFSFAILTTTPTDFILKNGHDRSPIFLNFNSVAEWLELPKTKNNSLDFIKSHQYNPLLQVQIDRPLKPGWEKRK